jgi:1,4-alpha-glucan branching enzyme
VTFVFYAPKAKSVSLVGTFNDWNPEKTPMNRGKDGTWSVQVSLPQGRHEYLFLVDGSRYESDPNALELRQDGMGNENAVLRL